jgi:hypothetical protein
MLLWLLVSRGAQAVHAAHQSAPCPTVQVLPTAPSSPQVIFVSAPFSWLPVALAAIQFLVLTVWAIYAYHRANTLKLREREATWYHKLVVDYSVENLTNFFRDSSEDLEAAAKDFKQHRDRGRQDLADGTIQSALAKFGTDLHGIANRVSDRIAVFDQATQQQFLKITDDLQGKVSHWFEDLATAENLDAAAPPLSSLNLSCKNELFKLLFGFEFNRWGLSKRK